MTLPIALYDWHDHGVLVLRDLKPAEAEPDCSIILFHRMPNLLQLREYSRGNLFSKDAHVIYRIVESRLRRPSDTYLEVGTHDNCSFFRLRDTETEETLGLLVAIDTHINQKLYRMISNVEAVRKHKGDGIFLYKVAITSSPHPVISDKFQSLPGSVNIWKKLRFRWNQRTHRISVLNLNSNKVNNWTRKTPLWQIWGMPQQALDAWEEFGDDTLLDDMLEGGDITFEHHEFLQQNHASLKERGHVRLYAIRKE